MMKSGFIFLAILLLHPLSAQHWEPVLSKGEPTSREACGFMSCKGKFFMLGGYGKPATDIFDPASATWSKGAAPPVEMHHFQATRHEGMIIVAGAMSGGGEEMRPLEHIYFYHTDTDEWERGPALPQGRERGSAGALVHKACLFLVGGSTGGRDARSIPWTDCLDLRNGKWKKLPDAPLARQGFHMAAIEGQAYVAGGTTVHSSSSEASLPGQVDVFRLDRKNWHSLPPGLNLPTLRSGAGAVAILDHLLVIGGRNVDNSDAFRCVEAFDVHGNRWMRWGDLVCGRYETQAFMCVGAVYIASGAMESEEHKPSAKMEVLIID